MPHAYLTPALESLFDEFNKLAPNRAKGADGGVGDRAHAERTSDHNIDDGPDQGATPYEDSDSTPEVHAADVTADLNHPTATMDLCAKIIVDRHRRGLDDRLQNVIWNGRIASDSWGWLWQDYDGADRHTGHAHFSGKYGTKQERDTRPWGLLERFEDEMDYETFRSYLRRAVAEDAEIRKQVASAVWTTDNVVSLDGPSGKKDSGGQSLVQWPRAGYAKTAADAGEQAVKELNAVRAQLNTIGATLAVIATGDGDGGDPPTAGEGDRAVTDTAAKSGTTKRADKR